MIGPELLNKMEILFIGSRSNVLNGLLNYYNYKIDIWALSDSYLENDLVNRNIYYNAFELNDKEKMIDHVLSKNYDVLISNGCPFILPVVNKVMINVHPTYLPFLRGKTPLNGVFYNNMEFIGATMHYISDKIDGGNVIYQDKHNISNELDQGLIYFLSFYLEGVVFLKGWEILLKSEFKFKGKPTDLSKGTYFNRTDDKTCIDFQKMETKDIVRVIKSFGIGSQGAWVKGVDENLKINKIFEASEINNELLLSIYRRFKTGQLLLKYDNKLLIKTIDSILKVNRYE